MTSGRVIVPVRPGVGPPGRELVEKPRVFVDGAGMTGLVVGFGSRGSGVVTGRGVGMTVGSGSPAPGSGVGSTGVGVGSDVPSSGPPELSPGASWSPGTSLSPGTS